MYKFLKIKIEILLLTGQNLYRVVGNVFYQQPFLTYTRTIYNLFHDRNNVINIIIITIQSL